MKILIAEDDAVASSVLELNLERMGYEVVVTSTGTEAWENFDRDPVRMVISDWQALLKLVKKGALISPKSEGRCLPCVSLVAPP